jgi:hypothetical protein
MQSLRYVLAALALGLISVWGSENFFWSAPPADLTAPDWLATWIAYSLVCACALSAVTLTGIDGLSAAFLGAVLMGFLIEGVIVDTMYDAFPFQLVWTPLAWHGLITGVCVFALGRAAPHWPLARHLLALLALGLFGAVFATFWPSERGTMPPGDVVLFYLAGIGLVVPLAQIVLDRIGTLPRPPLWVALTVPGLALALWIGKSLAAPAPQRLAFPVLVGLTLWTMRRLGGTDAVSFGPPGRVWRHLLFPIAPAVTALVAVPVWENIGALPGHIAVVLVTVPVSLLWWLWLLGRAVRRGSQPRSIASA